MSRPEVVVPEREGVAPDVKRSDWILDRVDALANSVKDAYIEVGGLLSDIRNWRLYRSRVHSRTGESYTSFEEYVEDRVGWKLRKAECLISIHRNLVVDAQLTRADLARLDWTKSWQISRLPPEERTHKKAREWVERAKATPVRNLTAEVKRIKSDTQSARAEPEEQPEGMRFALYPGQAKVVRRALDLAGRAARSDKPGRQLELVCMEFLTARAERREVKLNEMLAGIERIFDVRCFAVEDGADKVKIVYGRAAAKEMGVEE